MSTTFPADLQGFIEQELASGDFASESDVLIRALIVYRELKTRHAELRSEVQESIAAAERGEVTPLDISEITSIIAKEFDENRCSE